VAILLFIFLVVQWPIIVQTQLINSFPDLIKMTDSEKLSFCNHIHFTLIPISKKRENIMRISKNQNFKKWAFDFSQQNVNDK